MSSLVKIAAAPGSCGIGVRVQPVSCCRACVSGSFLGTILAFSATAGCIVAPPGANDGVDEAPVPGKLGGVCLFDGTCSQGLECIDGVCAEWEGEVETLVIFHNNSGPMCMAALDWLSGVHAEHPALVIEEHLTYEAGEAELLVQLEARFETSRGVSTTFGYLPIIFVRQQAFSGFDDAVAEALEGLLSSAVKTGS